jgi:biopolymer transport protein TolR
MSLAIRRHRRRKIKAEINVVPYIDVMLVLLVIFMITAPLLNLGVDVDLPRSTAKSLQQTSDPLIVRVAADGELALILPGDPQPQAMAPAELTARVRELVGRDPETQVLVGGAADASYQQVWNAIDLLVDADVKKVSLLSVPGAAAQ